VSDLYDEINKLVERRLKHVTEKGELVDTTEWVSQLAENLADMIVFGTPDELQAKMLIFAKERLEHFVLENQRTLAEDELFLGTELH